MLHSLRVWRKCSGAREAVVEEQEEGVHEEEAGNVCGDDRADGEMSYDLHDSSIIASSMQCPSGVTISALYLNSADFRSMSINF